MVIQNNNNWYKVATDKELPGLDRPIAVFKRSGAFEWEQLDVHFNSIEEAIEYTKYEDMLLN